MPKYVLKYFNGKGRAEVARLLFAHAGVEYEDVRIEFADWPKHKASTPLGFLPVLEIDGVQITDSVTVFRYIAKVTGLAGKTDLEAAQCDMIVSCCTSMLDAGVTYIFCKDETKKAELKKKLEEDTLPTGLGNLEKILSQNGGGDGYFVGNQMTWADVTFAHNITMTLKNFPTALDKYPKLKALKDRLEASPKIADWMKKRPVTDL